MKMRFPAHAYFFDLRKENFKFEIKNKVHEYEICLEGVSTNVSEDTCRHFVSALQKLGFSLDGC